MATSPRGSARRRVRPPNPSVLTAVHTDNHALAKIGIGGVVTHHLAIRTTATRGAAGGGTPPGGIFPIGS
jgi:hypothetical protein